LNGLAALPNGGVAYRSVDGGAQNIWVMDENGGQRRQVTADGVTSWPAGAPDGRSIVFSKEGDGLWRIGVDGQGAQPVRGTASDAFNAIVTSDNQWIYYDSVATGPRRLWKVPFGGGTPEQVLPGEAGGAAVSPDGRTLALYYAPRRDAEFTIALVPTGATTPAATFSVAPSIAYATVRWTKDGKAILHNSNVDDRANVWLQPVAGGPARKVTRFSDQIVFDFDVSADGKRLFIARGQLSRDAMLVRHFR
jgi:Tol biopolymer transport system component